MTMCDTRRRKKEEKQRVEQELMRKGGERWEVKDVKMTGKKEINPSAKNLRCFSSLLSVAPFHLFLLQFRKVFYLDQDDAILLE